MISISLTWNKKAEEQLPAPLRLDEIAVERIVLDRYCISVPVSWRNLLLLNPRPVGENMSFLKTVAL